MVLIIGGTHFVSRPLVIYQRGDTFYYFGDGLYKYDHVVAKKKQGLSLIEIIIFVEDFLSLFKNRMVTKTWLRETFKVGSNAWDWSMRSTISRVVWWKKLFSFKISYQ